MPEQTKHESTRAAEIKAELAIYSKFDQLEGRRKRALQHAEATKNAYYDKLRAKLIEATAPEFVATMEREKNADHLAYLERVAAAAAKQPELPVTEEVSDEDLVTE